MRIWIVVVFWLAFSCNDIRECNLAPSRDAVVVAFFEADSVEKFPKDTLVFYNGPDKSDTFTLPRGLGITFELNPNETTATAFLYTDSVNYELWLSYRKSLEIYFKDCDPVFTYTLDSVYSPNFDSVALVGAVLDNNFPLNVEIYF